MPKLESLQACNPSFSIYSQNNNQDQNDQENANYYIDLASGRGEDIVKKLRRAIALSPNKPTYQLLSGHIGSGKTTELLRLKSLLETQGFTVIYCAADIHLKIDDVGLTELCLVIFQMVLQQLETKEDSLSLAYLPNAIAEIEQSMRIATSTRTSTYGQRIQKILQVLQANEQHRRQLRHYLEPRLKKLLLASGDEVIAIEVERLRQLGKKGLVILVDNLDRLSIEQVEVIFGEDGKYLRQFHCHMIYTLPMLAIAHSDLTTARKTDDKQSRSDQPIVLPSLWLRDRHNQTNQINQINNEINAESLNLLRQVVLARMLPQVKPEHRLDQFVEQIAGQINSFDSLETLDLLCRSSQGNLPYLLSLLYGCLQRQEPPIDLETLNQVLEIDYAIRLSTITESDRQSLQKCLSSTNPLTIHELMLDVINLSRRRLLFEHHDAQGYWFSSPFAKPD